MIRSLYSAASGMVAQSLKQDIIANNIANAQTPGFKRSRVVSESFAEVMNKENINFPDLDRPAYPDSPLNPTLVQAKDNIDFSQGSIQVTGKPEDLAITGKGYFNVDTGQGIRYTRAGDFRLDKDRYLCTQAGEKVLGEKGPVKIPDAQWQIDDDGSVVSAGQTIDKLKITGGDAKDTRVLQGSLEGSNVSIIREMVGMIANMRAYEANQKVISSSDETLGKAVSEVGKVA